MGRIHASGGYDGVMKIWFRRREDTSRRVTVNLLGEFSQFHMDLSWTKVFTRDDSELVLTSDGNLTE